MVDGEALEAGAIVDAARIGRVVEGFGEGVRERGGQAVGKAFGEFGLEGVIPGGAEGGQEFRFFVGKGLGIGVFGLALGAVGGAALAAVLILVINRSYFGWTIQVSWPWSQLSGAAATILAAAILASLYPAARASRSPATELSRDDL